MAKVRLASGGTVNVLMQSLRGKRVRTRQQLRNHYGVIPAGTECTVSSTWRSGVTLDGPACGHCNIQLSISRVHRDDIELL